jgi:hypothetical protein
MYTMTVLTCSPMLILVPREELVRQNIVGSMKRQGISVNLDKKRDFVCITKNKIVTAEVLVQALEAAGLEQV